MQYYFNVQDGAILLDEEGLDFADFDDLKAEALRSSIDMLKELQGANFWSGEPWKLWVTDEPNGGGNTLLTLTFTARMPA